MSDPNPMQVVDDALDYAHLRPDDLPVHPSTLPCGRCGVILGHHRPSSVCPGFVRPGLPQDYAYVDQVEIGRRFRFLSRQFEECTRTLLSRECCVADHVVRIESAADRCAPATHWVQDNSIVVLH